MAVLGFDAGSIDARLTVDKSEFDTKLDAAEARGKQLEDRKLKVTVDADTTLANAKIDETKLKTDALGDSSENTGRKMQEATSGAQAFGGGVSLLAGSILAALPLVPELAAGVVALGGVATAAGAALGGFGAVALTDIQSATKATQELKAAQTAVDGATTPQARADALGRQKALIDSLGPSTIALGQAVSGLGTAWSSFAAGFTPELTRDIGAFTHLMTDAFPLVQPLITAGAGAVSTILSTLDTALQSPAARSFMAWLAGTAEHDILALASAFGHLGAGVLSLFQAFGPVETLMVNGLAAMTSGFATWAAHLSSTAGFQEFLRYVISNGPLLTKTLGDVVLAAGHILAALTPLLPPMLHIIDFVAELITKISGKAGFADAIDAVAVGFVGWKAISIATGLIQGLGGAIEPVLVKLGLLRDAEVAAGASVDVAPVVASIDGIGLAADANAGKLGGLLRLLGISSLADLGTLAGIGGAAAYIGYTQNDALKHLGSFITDFANPLNSGGSGGSGNANTNTPETSQGMGEYWLNGLPGSPKTPLPPFYLAAPGQPSQAMPTVSSQPSSTVGAGFGGVNDQTEANLKNTLISQVPGYERTVAWGAAGSSGGAGGGGTPTSYIAPLTGGGGGAGGASGPTTIQSMAALAAIQGLSIGQALTSAIVTGVNPLTPFFQSLQKNLSTAAQGIVSNLTTVFQAAMQYGQQAASSLLPNIITGLPAMGSITNVTVGPDGKLVSTPQSPILGGLQSVLGTNTRFASDIAQLTKAGLAQTLVSQFVQAGPSSLAAADALLSSAGDIPAINSTYGQITSVANTYGAQQATNQYLARIVDQNTQLIAAVQAQDSHPAAIAKAMTSPVKAGVLQAAATPAKGMYSTGGRR